MSTTPQDSQPAAEAGDQPTGHPKALWFVCWGEFAERASYYGMRAILPLYLNEQLKMPVTQAGPVYNGFKMACYFLPLLGGFLADRFFGRYWTIVGFSVPYVLGHFILGIESQTALFIALALLAGGSGVIKPNISTMLGQTYDQQRPGQDRLRSAAFLWFYFSINVGAFISTLALPELRRIYGYAVAFQFPAWLMVLALAVFAAGKPLYATESIERREATPEERRQKKETLQRLFGVFALMVFFWIAYEHNDSMWVYFTRDYVNLHVDWLDWTFPPDQLQMINPLLVMALIPAFNIFFKLADPDGVRIKPTTKILLGFLLLAAATATMTVAGSLAEGTERKLSIAWPVMAYVLLTTGEVLFYGTGLDLAYSVAPKSLKGFVTACFLVTNTLANFVNWGLTPLYGGSLTDPPDKRGPLSPSEFFGMTTLIVLVAAVAFYFVGRRFNQAGERGASAP